MADPSAQGSQPKGRLDIGTVVGLTCAASGIVGGLILEKGSVSDIAQGTAALIVFGGTVGAVLVSTPFPDVVAAARALSLLFFQPRYEPLGMLDQLISSAAKARKQGIVALEEDAASIGDPYLRRAIDLAIDGVTSTDLREMMEIEIISDEARTHAVAKVYETAGGYAPTIGIIGAVLGLIQVMKNLANIEEVGHGIAVAFVATIYGVGAANLLFLPAATKIHAHGSRRTALTSLITEGVAGIAEGMNPRMLRRKLEPMVNGQRVSSGSAFDTEAASQSQLPEVP